MDTRLAGLGIVVALVMSGCLRVHAAPNYETGDQNQSGEVLLERIWDPLDDIVFILIALSGLYWLIRVFLPTRTSSDVGSR